jgi:hypothetical protein
MQTSSAEAYKQNFIFPKCKISYVFLFRDSETQEVFFSAKAANTLTDAMNQPFFNNRELLQVIAIGDPTKETINFLTIDSNDRQFNSPLFEPDLHTNSKRKSI